MGLRDIVELIKIAVYVTGADLIDGLNLKMGTLRKNVADVQSVFTLFLGSIVARGVWDLVDAFSKTEQATILLNDALRVTGHYSEEATIKIQDAAKALERLTGIKAVDITRATSQLAVMARQLSTEQLVAAQGAMVALTQLSGGMMTLDRAAILVTKSLTSHTDALKRWGINIDMTADQNTRLTQISTQLQNKLEQFILSTDSLTGRLRILSTAWFNLKADMGNIIVQSTILGDKENNLATQVESVDDSLKRNTDRWVFWGRVVWSILQAIGAGIDGVIAIFWDQGRAFVAAIEWVVFKGRILWDEFFDFLRVNMAGFINSAIDQLNGWIASWDHFFGTFHGALPHIDTVAQHTADIRENGVKAAQAADSYKQAMADSLGDIRSMGGAWLDVFRIIEGGVQTLPDRRLAGGGPNGVPTEGSPEVDKARMRELEEAARLLEKQFADNNITIAEYKRRLSELVPQMNAFRATLHGEDLIKFDIAMEGLRRSSEQVGLTFDANGVRMMSFSEIWQREANKALKAMGSLKQVMDKMAEQTLKAFGEGIKNAFALFVEGSGKAGEAFAAAMLGALAKVAEGFAQFYLAKATADIFINPAAAAGEVAAATALFALAGVLAGLGTNEGSSPSGGGGTAANAAAANASASSSNLAPATITIEGGLLDMSDPRQADALAHAIQTLSGRRIIITGG